MEARRKQRSTGKLSRKKTALSFSEWKSNFVKYRNDHRLVDRAFKKLYPGETERDSKNFLPSGCWDEDLMELLYIYSVDAIDPRRRNWVWDRHSHLSRQVKDALTALTDSSSSIDRLLRSVTRDFPDLEIFFSALPILKALIDPSRVTLARISGKLQNFGRTKTSSVREFRLVVLVEYLKLVTKRKPGDKERAHYPELVTLLKATWAVHGIDKNWTAENLAARIRRFREAPGAAVLEDARKEASKMLGRRTTYLALKKLMSDKPELFQSKEPWPEISSPTHRIQ